MFIYNIVSFFILTSYLLLAFCLISLLVENGAKNKIMIVIGVVFLVTLIMNYVIIFGDV